MLSAFPCIPVSLLSGLSLGRCEGRVGERRGGVGKREREREREREEEERHTVPRCIHHCCYYQVLSVGPSPASRWCTCSGIIIMYIIIMYIIIIFMCIIFVFTYVIAVIIEFVSFCYVCVHHVLDCLYTAHAVCWSQSTARMCDKPWGPSTLAVTEHIL